MASDEDSLVLCDSLVVEELKGDSMITDDQYGDPLVPSGDQNVDSLPAPEEKFLLYTGQKGCSLTVPESMTRKSLVISGKLNGGSLISPKEETGGDSFGNSRWMSNLPSHLTKISLNRLAIPGSHNSGAYSLNPTTPMSPGKTE